MAKCPVCGWEYDRITAPACRDCNGDRHNRRNCLACGETGCEHTCMANQALNDFRDGMRKAAAERGPEVSWLLETKHGEPTLYYSTEGFCHVASHGDRFETQEEADAVGKKLVTPVHAKEHQWS